jgi:hypothetical protein
MQHAWDISVFKILVDVPKEKVPFEDPGVDGTILLKLILK